MGLRLSRSGRPSPEVAPPTLEESDRLVASYRWLERRRFELLGGWVSLTTELEVKLAFARHARHHAWHASLWEEHLPHRSGYEAPADPRPADRGLTVCIEALAEGEGPEATVERLVGAYRVLAARAETDYTALLARASPVSDAALARTGRVVLADQLHDRREGEAMLRALLEDSDRVERAAAIQARLEKLAMASSRGLDPIS
ncbi:MAG TPA: hypothetical protein VGV93_00130 [Acidimicrobiales bacterium]|nr:hypothetical protein [Acidimicrobiales bacterium]